MVCQRPAAVRNLKSHWWFLNPLFCALVCLVLWVDVLSMRGYGTPYRGHLRNTGSWSHEDLLNVTVFIVCCKKKITSPTDAEKSLQNRKLLWSSWWQIQIFKDPHLYLEASDHWQQVLLVAFWEARSVLHSLVRTVCWTPGLSDCCQPCHSHPAWSAVGVDPRNVRS